MRFDLRGQVVKGFGINEVAAGVFEQAGLKVEVAKRTALAVAWSARRKIFGEGGESFNPGGERGFFGEKQILQERLTDALEIIDVTVGLESDSRLIAEPRNEIMHVGLMFQDHQRGDVALRAGIAGNIEKALEIVEVA